jgi:hypothetical protein
MNRLCRSIIVAKALGEIWSCPSPARADSSTASEYSVTSLGVAGCSPAVVDRRQEPNQCDDDMTHTARRGTATAMPGV